MSDWIDEYMMRFDSVKFYFTEHHRISNEELALFFENPQKAKKLNKTLDESGQELFIILTKILSELYSMLTLLNRVNLYKKEWKDFIDNQEKYIKLFEERQKKETEEPNEEELQNKFRKYAILKYIDFYQNRYDFLFSSGELFRKKYKKNPKKINIERALL